MSASIELARQRRDELRAQIRLLTSRSRADDHSCEELGILPESDRMLDLKRHLAQIESLLEAAHEAPGFDAAWFSVDTPGPASAEARAV